MVLCLCVSLVVACNPAPEEGTPNTPNTPEQPTEPEQPTQPEQDSRNELVAQKGYPSGVEVYYFKNYYEESSDDYCSGYYAIVDTKSNPKLKFNAVYVENDATPSNIFASFAGGTPLLATNGGYFWDGESLEVCLTVEPHIEPLFGGFAAAPCKYHQRKG